MFTSITIQAQYVRPGDGGTTPPPGQPSQPIDNGFDQHLSIGGSFGLQFGDVTYVELEPLLSYHFTESFMVGIGPIYQYESVNAQIYGYGYTSSIFGGRVDAIYFLPDELSRVFAMGEVDVLNIPEASYYTYQINRGYISLPMLGIGYKDPISDKAFICAYILWNFNNSLYNPYTNPVINIGLDVGLWH